MDNNGGGEHSGFYMENMVGRRSALLSLEEQLAGQTLVSLETQDEFSQEDILSLRRKHAVTDQTLPHVLTEGDENLADHFVVSRLLHRDCSASSGHRLLGNPERPK